MDIDPSFAPRPHEAETPWALRPSDIATYDNTWGKGGWVIHFDCPVNETGQPYVVHSVAFHDRRQP